MKKSILITLVILILSCSKKENPSIEDSLPFTELSCNNLNSFTSTQDNWNIFGDAYSDRSKKNHIEGISGDGVLINIPSENNNENLLTKLEHGDIELEVDIMMSLASKSGIFFQGRYEIELSDSWGKKPVTPKTMGAILTHQKNHTPLTNVCKAPGLWQHLKVIFHAPKFDEKGKKIKNAVFEKVWLNGELIHEDIELKSTSKAGLTNEVALAPLMFQGKGGSVAFKNIRYKLYDNLKIGIENTTLSVYNIKKKFYRFESLNNLEKIKEIKVNSISPLTRFNSKDVNLYEYSGTLNIPKSGDYLFNLSVSGGALFIVDNDTIINMNDVYNPDVEKFQKVNLTQGKSSYTLIYNKSKAWGRHLNFYAEGPNMQSYSVLETSMIDLTKGQKNEPIVVKIKNQTKVQRGFMYYKNIKKTHTIAVGLPQKLNYVIDLSNGALLFAWGGKFLNTTDMWHSRGNNQLATPLGFTITFPEDREFAFLKDDNDTWPTKTNTDQIFKQIGYDLIDNKAPVFTYSINNALITNTISALPKEKRGLLKEIEIETDTAIWHKIADGNAINELDEKIYIVNDESYYIDFSANKNLETTIRTVDNKQQLLVKIPKGKQALSYSIIW